MTSHTSYSPFTADAPLRALAHELDPSPERLQLGRERYGDLGDWLTKHAANSVSRDVEVYPQGSFNLGTTNQDPFTTEFDIDLVLRIAYLKEQISQTDLNGIVGGWLGRYVSVRQRERHPLAPIALSKGKRAWTLPYDDHFHMDALPVVPATLDAPDTADGDRSWLTDKELTRWQPTDPRGFASWFRELTAAERLVLAKRAEVQVDDLPDTGPRSLLQIAIKILKRHRDFHFAGDPEKLAPPSALISALAARAYEGRRGPVGDDLAAVLDGIAGDMARFLDRRDGNLWVANPRCDEENYADRYAGDLRKERALRAWLGQVVDDLGTISSARGADVTKAIDAGFGDGLGQRVATQLGKRTTALREAGTLASTTSGLLAASGPMPAHRRHEFFGQ